jgi:hypothetical protein
VAVEERFSVIDKKPFHLVLLRLLQELTTSYLTSWLVILRDGFSLAADHSLLARRFEPFHMPVEGQ